MRRKFAQKLTPSQVNPLTKKETKFSKEYKLLPIMLIDGEQVNGSGEIIAHLHQRSLSEEEQVWSTWVDAHLVHLLPPNIYKTPKQALQSFDYITNQSKFSTMEAAVVKYMGAFVMYIVAKRSLEKYSISDPRAELAQACQKWTQEGVQDKGFHSGTSTPDVADLAVFGVIRSLEGNYETWQDLQLSAGDPFWVWYKAMGDAMPK